MAKETLWAVVTTRAEGFHQYADAPAEVEFLRHMHRHEFHYRLELEQFHDGRDVEFILLKRWLNRVVAAVGCRAGASGDSCETKAIRIHDALELDFPGRRHRISVFEDGENGALVEFL